MVILGCIHLKDYLFVQYNVYKVLTSYECNYIRVYHRFSFLLMTCH